MQISGQISQDPSPHSGVATPPSIGDYAMIGDGRTAAMISKDGGIDWLCLPHFSAPSIFAAMLDPERGGRWVIRPQGKFRTSRRYRPGTPILETTFETESGAVRVIDFLPVDDGFHQLLPMREVVRIVEGVRGQVPMEIVIDPRPDYARRKVAPTGRGKLGFAYAWSRNLLLIRADVPLAIADTTLRADITLSAGQRRRFSLAFAENDPGVIPVLGPELETRLASTTAWWQSWSRKCTYRGPHREAVCRSALVLKLLTFCQSGAVTAAGTTSLPEWIGGERNWDYRFCWLRDAGMTVQALVGLGYMDDADYFLGWLLHATRLTWPKLQVVYDVYGHTNLTERVLSHLRGFRDSAPVRVGNAAAKQHQLDVYGEILSASAAFVAGGGHLTDSEKRMLRGFGMTVVKEWEKPDHGIWEVRGPPRDYTFSKMMSWLALDCLLRMAQDGVMDLGEDRVVLSRERDKILAAIETRAFNPALNAYVDAFAGDQLDASLLLMGCIGYRDAGDPRMRSTYDRIWADLGEGDFIHRYGDRFDHLPGREGAFIMLSFWAVQNLAGRGDVDAAEALFDRLLRYGNDVGLFSEEIDPPTGTPLGNTPQAFSHTALVNAALAIAAARRKPS